MPKPIAFLVFLIVEIVLLPITIMGGILFAVDFIKLRVARTSMTAYDPLFAHWLLNEQGKRKDDAWPLPASSSRCEASASSSAPDGFGKAIYWRETMDDAGAIS